MPIYCTIFLAPYNALITFHSIFNQKKSLSSSTCKAVENSESKLLSTVCTQEPEPNLNKYILISVVLIFFSIKTLKLGHTLLHLLYLFICFVWGHNRQCTCLIPDTAAGISSMGSEQYLHLLYLLFICFVLGPQ